MNSHRNPNIVALSLTQIELFSGYSHNLKKRIRMQLDIKDSLNYWNIKWSTYPTNVISKRGLGIHQSSQILAQTWLRFVSNQRPFSQVEIHEKDISLDKAELKYICQRNSQGFESQIGDSFQIL